MKSKIVAGAALIFGSGLSALLYQTTWVREFRLIFGNSTAASAAVLGIFMGGLGLGSALLGRRAETSRLPLGFYARLEFLIAMSAALTPALIWLIRAAYIASGGTSAMGSLGGTCVRLLLTSVVLAIPTLLMGGTLPAMARFAVSDNDTNRRGLALLYGMNTLGAVAGAVLGTFFLFERFGNHTTLYLACILNAGVAGFAWIIARDEERQEGHAPAPDQICDSPENAVPLPLILIAAAMTGFVFLLMELVWYRMLSPMFGGTAFTFGLILAVALLGIGVGGVMYSLMPGKRRPTSNGFATTCALEALCLTIPFALGDRLAVVAMLLQPLGTIGFAGHVLSWLSLCLIIVFPAAVIAGIQFPMLLGLLGRGRENVGAQTGVAYAWNTAGAIAGSLAGGFGLIPILTAPGAWKLAIVLLIACAVVAVFVGQRQIVKPLTAIPSILTSGLVILIVASATGPTAAWRHGQLDRLKRYSSTPNQIRDLMHLLRRDILWQADGIESSIGITKTNSLGFIVNGKCDGNAKADAGTQVMCGLVGALSHPHLQRAAVIGLGTGSTAGWLAAIPSVARVDVMELEPVIARFAAQCATVNHDALSNPKLNLIFGDARELLLTTSEKYDLIVSEPSNPYRAGVASLFTREYYETVAQNLNRGGVFAQWLQAYDVDLRTIRIFYATLSAVFPNIETWQTQNGDLLLIGSKDRISYDIDLLRARIASEPFRSALPSVWRTNDLEGVFSHYIGNGKFAGTVMHRAGVPLNTDDRMLLEFAFARNHQSARNLNFNEMRSDAARFGANRPQARGDLDWSKVEEQRLEMFLAVNGTSPATASLSAEHARLVDALSSYLKEDFPAAWESWKSLAREPHNPVELAMVAECLADRNDATALGYIDQLARIRSTDANAIRARLLWKQGRIAEARAMAESVLLSMRSDPWPVDSLIVRTMKVAVDTAYAEATATGGQLIYDALKQPFAVHNSDGMRLNALMSMAMVLDRGSRGQHVLESFQAAEPHIQWTLDSLKMRSDCYAAFHHPLADEAQTDLVDFLEAESGGLESAKPSHFQPDNGVVTAAK